MRSFLLFVFFLVTGISFSQTKVLGKVVDEKGSGIPAANVVLKGTYDGATTDTDGNFSFTTDETGEQTIQVIMVGFDAYEQKIKLEGKDIVLKIRLSEKVTSLNAVTISAGAFEASDERKMVVLRPLDIVTTAGAAGDIYGALQTLPGTQQVGETEGLFVRGGDASETRTIIDGVHVSNPYFSSVPDVPQRGRFSPFFFKGTYFSTGGYSAQYGQAMSSALILESQDLAENTSSNIGLMTIGGGLGRQILAKDKRSSVSVNANYTNLTPYMAVVKQNRDWTAPPEAFSGSIVFRKKTNETGMLKGFVNFGYNDLSLRYTDINDSTMTRKTAFALYSNNFFSNLSYKQRFKEKWMLFVSSAYSKNLDVIHPDTNRVEAVSDLVQGRITVTRYVGKLSAIRFGAEVESPVFSTRFDAFPQSKFNDMFTAGYAEGDIYLTKKLVSRLGARVESSSALNKMNLAPRASLAYKTGETSQFSVAYGDFFQTPDRSFITSTTSLDFERSSHYILNYQVVTDVRTFRVEAYYKQYNDLVRTSFPDTTSRGTGYAQGFELFWRDKRTIRYADYWISYSYLDTRREYLNYPKEVTPPFAAQHTATIVFKRWFEKKNISAGFTYSFATGRPYYNPNNPDFMSDRTKNFHNLSINASKLTTIKGNFAVLVLSVSNVLGIENVFTYHYSYDGRRSTPVGPTAKRGFFIGLFISIGQDKGDDTNN